MRLYSTTYVYMYVPNTEGNDKDEFCCNAPTVFSISSGAALPRAAHVIYEMKKWTNKEGNDHINKKYTNERIKMTELTYLPTRVTAATSSGTLNCLMNTSTAGIKCSSQTTRTSHMERISKIKMK